jgi:hypothetical protein
MPTFKLTDDEVKKLCNQVNMEIDNILSQLRDLKKVGAKFLGSLADKLELKPNLDNEDQIRCFMRQPIQELLKSDENEDKPELIINSLSGERYVENLVFETKLLRDPYDKLHDEGLVEEDWVAVDILLTLFRKILQKQK